MPFYFDFAKIRVSLARLGFIVPSIVVILLVSIFIVAGALDRQQEVNETRNLTRVIDRIGAHRYLAVTARALAAEQAMGLENARSTSIDALFAKLRSVNAEAIELSTMSASLKASGVPEELSRLASLIVELEAAVRMIVDNPDKAEAQSVIQDQSTLIVNTASWLNETIGKVMAPEHQTREHLLQDVLSALIVLVLGAYLVFVLLPVRQKMRSEASRFVALSDEVWKLSMIARRTTNSVVITDTDGRIEWVNDSFQKMTGFSLDEVKGRKPGDLLQYEGTDPATVSAISAANRTRQPIEAEIRNRGKDGREYWISMSIQPLMNARGEHVGFMAIQSDITRAKADAALMAERHFDLQMMSQLANVGAWSIDLATNTPFWSDHVRVLHEVPADYVPDMETAVSFYPEDARIAIAAGIEKSITTGADWNDELPLITATGRERRVKIFARPTYTGTVPTKIVGAIQDVTELAQARDALVQSSKRLELAVESGSLGLWEWDIATDTTWTHPAWWKHLGFDPSTVATSDDAWDSFIHPDDLEQVRARRKQFLDGTVEALHNEFRFRSGSGEWRWVSVVGQATERRPDGSVTRAYGVNMDIHGQRLASDKIRYTASHDAMTGMLNRQEIRRIVNDELLRAGAAPFCLFILDLDRFKHVNDTFGHAAGDHVLKTVSQRMIGIVREGDAVARLGGDEFCLVIRCTGDWQAFGAAIAERLIAAIREPIHFNGTDLSIGVSIGIALAPDHGADFDTLLLNADTALYKVKASGKNNFRMFDEDILAETSLRRTLELDLAKAVARNELELHFQKQVRLSDGALMGAEALLRWHHPVHGLVSPDVFIPIAEETGLIVPIGNWVIETACREAATWPKDLVVSVNLSVAQLGKSNIYDWTMTCLLKSGLSPHQLELEVTESIFLRNDESMLSDLIRLHDLGVKLALDDFGTGYASLSYLQKLPFDKIKLDKSFMQTLDDSPTALAIVGGIAQFAEKLGVVTTAEGVETHGQLAMLAECGYTYGQGYYFGRPAPAADFRAQLGTGSKVVYPFRR